MKEQWPHLDEVCKYIAETDTFTSSVTRETYKINNRLDCNDKCLVYCLLVTNVKNNKMAKLLTTFLADGIITSLKVEVLKEEKSVFKNSYTNILKKDILSFSVMF